MTGFEIESIVGDAMTQLEYARVLWQDAENGYFLDKGGKDTLTRLNLLGEVIDKAYALLEEAVIPKAVSA